MHHALKTESNSSDIDVDAVCGGTNTTTVVVAIVMTVVVVVPE